LFSSSPLSLSEKIYFVHFYLVFYLLLFVYFLCFSSLVDNHSEHFRYLQMFAFSRNEMLLILEVVVLKGQVGEVFFCCIQTSTRQSK
jgi:hypothetical protein